MYCNYCGAWVAGDDRICPACGKKLPALDGDESKGVEPTPWKERCEIDTIEARDVTFGTAQPLSEDEEGQMYLPDFMTQAENAVSRKNRRKIRWLQGGILAVLAVTLLIFIWFVIPSGPAEELAGAVKNTLEQGSLTAKFFYTTEEGISTGTLQLEIDPEARELILHAQGGNGNNRSVTIYDGYLIVSAGQISFAYDISRDLEELFDSYRELQEKPLNGEMLLKLLEQIIVDPEDRIDPQKLEKCVIDYWKCLNDEDWLEDYAGFRKEKQEDMTSYTFKPDLYDFTCGSMLYLEKAFIDSEDYHRMLSEVRSAKTALDGTKLELGIGVQEDVLSYVAFAVEGGVELRLDFTAVGSTHMDQNQLKALLDRAMRMG